MQIILSVGISSPLCTTQVGQVAHEVVMEDKQMTLGHVLIPLGHWD